MSLQSHLAVMRNAFSTATTAPKVPDGKCSHSVGQRNAFSFTKASKEGRITICLEPSIAVPLLVSGDTVVSNANLGTSINNAQLCLKTPQVVLGVFSGTKDKQSLDRYRIVSQGMRVTPINNSESNNGWFEAVRVASTFDRKHLVAYEPAGVVTTVTTSTAPTQGDSGMEIDEDTPADYGGFGLSHTAEGNMINEKNWANHPSYVTGRLRDLGKHYFGLQCIGERDMSLFTDDQTSGSMLFDQNYDVIYLRIYSTPATDTSVQTAVHIHAVQNLEGTYDSQSSMSRFQSTCMSSPGAVINTTRSINRDPKASTIRASTSYYGR